MKALLTIILFAIVTVSLTTKLDEAPSTRVYFSPFQDTIVAGFDTEIYLQTDYDTKRLSVTGTHCTIMLKNAEKGIYLVKAPMTSVGKKCQFSVTYKNAQGSLVNLYKVTIPIVSMTPEMKIRYVNHQIHTKK